MKDEEKDAHPRRSIVTWGPVAAVVVTVSIYFLAQILGGLLVSIYPTLRHWKQAQINTWFDHSVIAQFALVLAIEGLTLLLLRAFLHHRRATFRTLGLNRPRLKHLLYVLAGFAIYFVVLIAAMQVLKALFPSLNLDQKQQLGFETAKSAGQLSLVFMSLVLLPPFVEEILARGFLFLGLKSRLPIVWAVIITSVIFAAGHLQFGSGAPLLWAAAIDTFVLSLVLIYIRELSNSLWPPIGLHMLKNGLAFLTLFVFIGK